MDNYDAMVIGGGVVGLVVLGGGGRHRIHEGARLALAGVAPWLVVTNTRVSWPGVRASYAELMAQEAQWRGTLCSTTGSSLNAFVGACG